MGACARWLVCAVLLIACGEAAEIAPPPTVPAPSPPAVDAGAPPAADLSDAGAPLDAGAVATDAGAEKPAQSACPADMIYVDTTYCTNMQRRCIKDEYDKPNHLTICHEFAKEQKCIGKERRQRFCIDRYEYPNEKGAHPPVMVDWYDAAGACAAQGKRLCWESEWVSACEGPEKLPFPYGRKRDPKACNIDNTYKGPNLDAVYSKNAAVQDKELTRLDQSTPSGDKAGCVSGFGVHDLTGNFDEWVLAEEEVGESKWARLKGGAWGHVRNACRPYTTSHPPEFTYYFISFRCCADAAPEGGAAAGAGTEAYWKPPPPPNKPDPSGRVSPGWTPKKKKP
jgi:hypothetical protein